MDCGAREFQTIILDQKKKYKKKLNSGQQPKTYILVILIHFSRHFEFFKDGSV